LADAYHRREKISNSHVFIISLLSTYLQGNITKIYNISCNIIVYYPRLTYADYKGKGRRRLTIELSDCRQLVGNGAKREETRQIELQAVALLECFSKYGSNPDKKSLDLVLGFLKRVECWKQMGQESKVIYAEQNRSKDIWDCLVGVKGAKTDEDAFSLVMRLKGFGQRGGAAKQASAVLRFIDPYRWGTVDWRNAAMIELYEKNGKDVDIAVEKAKNENWKKYKDKYDYMDEKNASHYQEKYRAYRCERLPRSADVDLAFWGMSLKAWPIPFT
jgi:hypothetical protein